MVRTRTGNSTAGAARKKKAVPKAPVKKTKTTAKRDKGPPAPHGEGSRAGKSFTGINALSNESIVPEGLPGAGLTINEWVTALGDDALESTPTPGYRHDRFVVADGGENTFIELQATESPVKAAVTYLLKYVLKRRSVGDKCANAVGWLQNAASGSFGFVTPASEADRCGPEEAKHCCVFLVTISDIHQASPEPEGAEGEEDELRSVHCHDGNEYVVHSCCAVHAVARGKCRMRRGNVSGARGAIKCTAVVHKKALTHIARVGNMKEKVAQLVGKRGRSARKINRKLEALEEELDLVAEFFIHAKVEAETEPAKDEEVAVDKPAKPATNFFHKYNVPGGGAEEPEVLEIESEDDDDEEDSEDGESGESGESEEE